MACTKRFLLYAPLLSICAVFLSILFLSPMYAFAAAKPQLTLNLQQGPLGDAQFKGEKSSHGTGKLELR